MLPIFEDVFCLQRFAALTAELTAVPGTIVVDTTTALVRGGSELPRREALA